MTKENCSSCKFYVSQRCKKRCPSIVTYTESTNDGYGSDDYITTWEKTEWPAVSWDDWCGEYEQKENGETND